MHVSVHNVKHARDTGPTKVNIQDANLRDTSATSGITTHCIFQYCTQCAVHKWKTKWCFFDISPSSLMDGNAGPALAHSSQLTFFPACLRASANSVVMVLFPTPPFPDRTNTTCRTWAMFPSHLKRVGNWLILPYLLRYVKNFQHLKAGKLLHYCHKIVSFKIWHSSKQASHHLSLHVLGWS